MATITTPENDRAAIEAFERDVLAPSMDALIILDFHAEWCGPCKQVGPILDKVAADYADKGVKLVKVDVDKEPVIAAQFRVQSVPTIYAIHKGQPVADLTQARTEPQFKQFLDQILPQLKLGEDGGADAQLAEAIAAGKTEAKALLAAGEERKALEILAQLIQQAPDDEEILGGAAVALIALGDTGQAETLIAKVPEESKTPEIVQARKALALGENAVDEGELETLKAAADANPDDHDARISYADALAGAGQGEQAADEYLASIERDREHADGAARKKLLELFEASGVGTAWVMAARRKLSTILFA
ncbi:MAG: tetratricopeptide repeat protein [Pacificimonas sp.]